MNFLRKAIIQAPLRRQLTKKRGPAVPLVKRKIKQEVKRSPGFLQQTLEKLKHTVVPISTSPVEEVEKALVINISLSSYFKQLDEPLRFIFKVPFIQNFYIVWLRKEDMELSEALKEKFHNIFLWELVFYSKLGIETFEKLIMTNYPEIIALPDSRENLIILHHLVTRNKGHIEESLYQMQRERKEEDESDHDSSVMIPSLSTRTYYKYIDFSVRPLFKFEVVQTIFGRWLKIEDISIHDCYDAHYHNLFMEELLYYHDQGEGFIRSIIKNIYTMPNNEELTPFSEEDLNTIFTLIKTFDAILDDTVKKIKENQGDGTDIDRKQFLNHGYDFGMLLYYVAVKDPLNALMTARGLVIEAASKILDKKEKKKGKLGEVKKKE